MPREFKFSSLDDLKYWTATIFRGKQLNPHLIITTTELHETKVFFKFCQNAGIIIDEEEHESFSMKKFRKELIDDTKIAKTYQKQFNQKLTIARALRWKDFVGSVDGYDKTIPDFVDVFDLTS